MIDRDPDGDEPNETPLPSHDVVVDVASDESFPASDPPSYPAVSASKPVPDEHQDVVPDPRRGPGSDPSPAGEAAPED